MSGDHPSTRKHLRFEIEGGDEAVAEALAVLEANEQATAAPAPNARAESEDAVALVDMSPEALGLEAMTAPTREIDLEQALEEASTSEASILDASPQTPPPSPAPHTTATQADPQQAEGGRIGEPRLAEAEPPSVAPSVAPSSGRQRERRRSGREILRLRQEILRLRAQNQRLRDRLERTEEARRMSERSCQETERSLESLQDLHQQLAEQHTHLKERRRQDQVDQRLHGHAAAVTSLLPVLDHLQMATRHASADPNSVLQGVNMVVDQFASTLQRLGVQSIDASPGTPFQPDRHEAMMHISTDEHPVGHIVEEIAAGYTLNGRLLRATRVSVAAPVKKETPPVEDSLFEDIDLLDEE